MQTRRIIFLKPNRYGVSVYDEREWELNVCDVLVQRGIAAYADEAPLPQIAAVISQPVLTTLPEAPDELPAAADAEPIKDPPKRKKRSESTEE